MNKALRISLSIIFVVLYILICLIPTNTMTVSALNISVQGGYTTALEDLSTDENFNIENYPMIEDDYSLQVIKIAESSDKELFVYVYQPSADSKNIVATSLFLSTNPRGLDYKNYYLTLLSKNEVFYKYRVKNFVVSSKSTRDYEITSIYRKFDETIDKALENDNIINEVEYKVARHWVFTTTDNGIEIGSHDIETIEITNKFVGFARYEDGNWWHLWGESACDRHFVAFSTDRQIDELMEADVFYQSQRVRKNIPLDPFHVETLEFSDPEDNYAYLTYSQKGSYDNNHHYYEWNRIQNVNDFIDSVDLSTTYSCGVFDVYNSSKITTENVQELKKNEWVLSFLETEYKKISTLENETYRFTRVGNVSILRLRFETNGIIYDLGVIDNKQSGSDKPINIWKTELELKDTFKILLLLVLIVIIVIVLGPILPTIISVLVWVVKTVFKIVWWIISLPFRLFSKNKKKTRY